MRSGNGQPVFIAAMAGGADTATRSGFGAALAVSTLVNIVEDELTADFETGRLAKLLRGAVGEVQLIIELKAEHDHRPVGDYASTLLAVILTESGGIIGQIGAGGALIQEDDGAWRPVDWPGQGGDANKTQFLTEADAFAAFQIAALPSIPRRICLFSSEFERMVTPVRA